MLAGSLEGEGGARCDADGLGARDLAGELGRCKDGIEGRGFSCDAWSCDSIVPAEEGLESRDTTLPMVASDGLWAGIFSVFSVEGARRSSVRGGAVGVTARLLAAELPDRVVVGVVDRVADRAADRAEIEKVAARASPVGGVLVRLEGGVFAFIAAVGVTGLRAAEKVLDRVNAVGVADRRVVVDGAPAWAVGVAGRRTGSRDLEGGFSAVDPARLVAEPVACASPVGLLSSSFGFPAMDMLADLPLVWTDGLVRVVDGGYLLVDAVFSFLAATSRVAPIVIDLVRRPGMPDALGAPAVLPVSVPPAVVMAMAAFFKLAIELPELEATETARAPCLRPGSRVGEMVRGSDGSRVLDVLVGIDGMPVLERNERERGIEEDMAVAGGRFRAGLLQV
ncbi:hypothetical protein Trco_000396 [Trichoderma cornu-damae]|uniref:Uncharacterized protein n=1 Tax=Trichoderma cornu-damae TaxID=654480 RepID=A0A9P8QQ75_9HYPO|nr:hypothetical protein Trco_000396 [Trichoderma cornu-damae]